MWVCEHANPQGIDKKKLWKLYDYSMILYNVILYYHYIAVHKASCRKIKYRVNWIIVQFYDCFDR